MRPVSSAFPSARWKSTVPIAPASTGPTYRKIGGRIVYSVDDLQAWCAMIVALLNQKGGVGKTMLALNLAGEWAGQGKRVTVIDV